MKRQPSVAPLAFVRRVTLPVMLLAVCTLSSCGQQTPTAAAINPPTTSKQAAILGCRARVDAMIVNLNNMYSRGQKTAPYTFTMSESSRRALCGF